jgi:hypothetical protein
MATMAYEFVRVEKTPTLLVGSQLAVLTSDRLAPQPKAMRPWCGGWMDGWTEDVLTRLSSQTVRGPPFWETMAEATSSMCAVFCLVSWSS